MLAQSILETTRLILRPLSLADAPSLQSVASVREIADTMISIPHYKLKSYLKVPRPQSNKVNEVAQTNFKKNCGRLSK
ncbi:MULTISPECIES: hypothetical protein [unclassified Microcoleus]|uniref:hypothetical protein n=1 Tax=unclassified Microcoleus TaxID=2642155 RepID=UPI001D9EFE31|nr:MULTISPECIES: hypothetical protein [unclassified Microcoleus]MCC3447563.1 hypothetical protein [Microcoleus sp. PH2017_09_SFU_O_A]MCC3550988.1 hypothetical protein [Microcoleus sp. PH2017_24_DOB_U_A]MCC3551502.1 hypothetical protein [Microcoleus sp. PH2017_35_SFW_U_B]MCC3584116.1 hypothetical protein [Microcoleus sp. PH2017_30_WIL_O_A]MCC3628542.1 hypothetical protein [Microcoleus sp. PH2017_39_LGB_O_B]